VVAIVNHRNLQDLQKLAFCYSCGKPFAEGDVITRDHVPPTACFAVGDRLRPLILPAHDECNASYKVGDERIGQVISLRHGRITARKNRRLTFRHFQTPDRQQHIAVDNVNILGAIERWIRAFHAALYREPLSPETRFGIETPFAVAVPNASGGVGVDSGRIQQHRLFVETIKHNRALGVIDQIVANNGKLRYECVWQQASNNRNWLCIFGFDIYNWADLGRTALAPQKGCVGFYQYLLSDAPAIATRATIVRSTSTNAEPLDPFGV
jgi:hypothetical protein